MYLMNIWCARKTGERQVREIKQRERNQQVKHFFAYSLAITWDKNTLLVHAHFSITVHRQGTRKRFLASSRKEARARETLRTEVKHQTKTQKCSAAQISRVSKKRESWNFLDKNLFKYEQHNYFMVEYVNHSKHPNIKPKPHKDNPQSINQLFQWN